MLSIQYKYTVNSLLYDRRSFDRESFFFASAVVIITVILLFIFVCLSVRCYVTSKKVKRFVFCILRSSKNVVQLQICHLLSYHIIHKSCQTRLLNFFWSQLLIVFDIKISSLDEKTSKMITFLTDWNPRISFYRAIRFSGG